MQCLIFFIQKIIPIFSGPKFRKPKLHALFFMFRFMCFYSRQQGWVHITFNELVWTEVCISCGQCAVRHFIPFCNVCHTRHLLSLFIQGRCNSTIFQYFIVYMSISVPIFHDLYEYPHSNLSFLIWIPSFHSFMDYLNTSVPIFHDEYHFNLSWFI